MSNEAENNDTNGAGWSALRPLTGSEADELRRTHRRAMQYAVKTHARQEARIAGLVEALEIIAGERPALDNLMGNVDVAADALKRFRESSPNVDYKEQDSALTNKTQNKP